MDRPGPDDPVAVIHDLIIDFSRATRLRSHDMYGGLSFITYAVLTFVDTAACPHAADLVIEYGLDKSTVSRQIAALIDEGLLEREPDPDHARMHRLSLTAVGRRTLRRIRTEQRRRLKESLSDWPDRDIEQFSQLLSRFVTRI